MYFVYVLYSPSLNQLYTGQTKNVRKRVEHHNLGLDRWSKRGIPWTLVYHEEVGSRSAALKRERYLKSGAGKKVLKSKIVLPS